MITSPDNPQIRDLKKLTTRKYRRRLNRFLVDDPKTIREGIAAGHQPEAIYTCLPDQQDLFPDSILVDEKLLAPLSDQPSFSGWMAVFPIPQPGPNHVTARSLILEVVQDPANLGTICRSAALFGIDTVWMTPGCADPFSLKVIRSAKGAIFRLNLVRETLEGILTLLDNNGVPVVAADTRAGLGLDELPELNLFGLALGSEGHGITETLRNACTHTVTIRTSDVLESLNVSAAAAILLHHLYNHQSPKQ